HYSSRGGNVEGVGQVPSSAACIDNALGGQYLRSLLTHYPRSACDLFDGFTLDPECGEKCADLGIRGPALHYFGHAFGHFSLGEADILNYKVYRFFYHCSLPSCMKFLRRSLPDEVSIDSGWNCTPST